MKRETMEKMFTDALRAKDVEIAELKERLALAELTKPFPDSIEEYKGRMLKKILKFLEIKS